MKIESVPDKYACALQLLPGAFQCLISDAYSIFKLLLSNLSLFALVAKVGLYPEEDPQQQHCRNCAAGP